MKHTTFAVAGLIALSLFGTVACGSRVPTPEYSRQRGQITSAYGAVLARSDPVDDQYSYQRVYPGGAVYADLTGYDSMRYRLTGLERDQNEILSGEDSKSIAGANVELNIAPSVQEAAYTAMTEKGYVGAVVAIQPATGKVLAVVSTPSYDPNPLASHSDEVQRQAYNALVNADPSPLINRAIGAVYRPAPRSSW
jgi:peptidoglycan glycosyltransferase